MIITPAMLEDDCSQIVLKVGSYSATLQLLLSVMYATGCREAEVLDRARWTGRPDLDWDLQPQKGNPVRIIPAADVPAPFVAWINSKGYPSALSSRSNLRRAVRIFSSYPFMSCGGKGISSHRFRHNRIKQLKLAGASEAEIKEFMGLISSSIINGYANSTLQA